MPGFLLAQSGVDDAVRISRQGLNFNARALGMGNAYTGVANDFSAIYWNPAGLAQLQSSEFSFGLTYNNNKDNIYYKQFGLLYGDGKIKIKLVLMVNVYQMKTNIWLKPLCQDETSLDKSWLPTQRGFQFTLKDDGRKLKCQNLH